MTKTAIEKTAEYVKKRLEGEASGHDWQHSRRVWEIAKRIQKIEGGNLELVELAALLHCAAEHDLKRIQEENSRSLTMNGIFDVLDIKEEYRQPIINSAQQCRYKGYETDKPTTIEGKIVQDANWIDGMGAIGVARVFAVGGYLGRVMYDPAIQPLKSVDKEMFNKHRREGTSVNYLYEKNLQLLSILNTATAKKIALQRFTFLQNFMKEFIQEWDGQDLDEAIKSSFEGSLT